MDAGEYYDRLQAMREKGTGSPVSGSSWRGALVRRRVYECDPADSHKAGRAATSCALLTTCLPGLRPLRKLLASALDIQYATANNLFARLVELGILSEMTGYRRFRRFAYQKYLNMFEGETAPGLAREDEISGAAIEQTGNEPPEW
jgi:hypothetical protein